MTQNETGVCQPQCLLQPHATLMMITSYGKMYVCAHNLRLYSYMQTFLFN